MGRAKDAWMEEQERGWADPGTFVCDRCIHDPYLADLVRQNAQQRHCDYCGRRARLANASPAADIIEAIGKAVHHYYNDPTDAGVPYDGGFIVEPVGIDEVLLDLGLDCSDAFWQAVSGAFGASMWVPSVRGHWNGSQLSDRMRYSWSSFQQLVKHKTRYHFAHRQADDREELSPTEFLEAIGHAAETLGIVSTIERGTLLHRARVRVAGSAWEPDAQTMGAPPSGLASAGRMNPPGISYLYCALERETALGELAPAPPVELVAAQFALCSDVRVLNLCELPKSPSVYDVACNDELEWLGFLHSFAREISRPVRKDGSEHVDYVPSQVVCEWFAQVHSEGDGGATLDGILYPSAVVPGGKNLVLFPQRDALRKAMFNAVEFRAYEKLELTNWVKLASALGFAHSRQT